MAVNGKHGAVLGGRYRLLEQLGGGGMGSVWKAEHLLLHSQVAIKLIDPEVARLDLNLGRFLREATTLATLRSPHIVQVLDFGCDEDTPYLVMELLQGQTLGRRLDEQRRLSLAETSSVLHDVCVAMSLVHEQGLIHRDLKPENIFLCDAGDQRVTKLVDFGIAKSTRGDALESLKTRTGHLLGTPTYMSPEQCRGLKDIDHRADLWALGVIAYECLVGQVPFQAETFGDLLLRICMDPLPIPSAHAKDGLPSAFDAWFAKSVARDRSTRFQSASELASAFAQISQASSLAATPSDGDSVGPSRAPSSPRVVAGAATPRRPSHTEAGAANGLGPAFGRRAERRARFLAVAALTGVAALGLWALGTERAAGVPVDVDAQSLQPPFESTPRRFRSRVPTGRRWLAAPGPAPSNTMPLQPLSPDALRWAPPAFRRAP